MGLLLCCTLMSPILEHHVAYGNSPHGVFSPWDSGGTSIVTSFTPVRWPLAIFLVSVSVNFLFAGTYETLSHLRLLRGLTVGGLNLPSQNQWPCLKMILPRVGEDTLHSIAHHRFSIVIRQRRWVLTVTTGILEYSIAVKFWTWPCFWRLTLLNKYSVGYPVVSYWQVDQLHWFSDLVRKESLCGYQDSRCTRPLNWALV